VDQDGLILLAEDSDVFRAQVKRFLEADGHRVIDAADGEEAWDLLIKNLAKVQILVTDIEMPRLSGLELTARIRFDERTKTLPVIAVSSLAGDEDLAKAKAAGVNEYEIKLDRDNLLNSVRSILARQTCHLAACSAD
jgi:two-component system chemotaxis sensor kinase CheA